MNQKRFLLIGSMLIGFALQTPAQSLALTPWWEVFQNPFLNRYATMVLEDNHDIKAAKASVLGDKITAKITRSEWYPNIDLIARSGRGNANAFQDASVTQVGVQSTWDLDIFGSTRFDVKAADARLHSGACACCETKKRVLSELVLAMITYQENKAVYDLVLEELSVFDAQIEVQNDIIKAGFSNHVALYQLSATRAEIAAQLPSLDAAKTAALYQIHQLTGVTDNRIFTELQTEPLPSLLLPSNNVLSDITLDTLQERLDVKKARAEITAADADLAATEAELWPKISLNAFYAGQKTTEGVIQNGDRVWDVSAEARYPLFNFGRLKNQSKVADAKTLQVVNQYESTLRKAFQESQTAFVNYTNALNSVQCFKLVSEERQKARGILMDRYHAGLTPFIQTLTPDLDYIHAKTRLAHEKSDAARAYVRLVMAL